MSSLSSSYTWQRRWLYITSNTDSLKHPYNIDSAGYVVGTEWGPGLVLKPLGITLEQLPQDIKCAVLLGEPGIGKSFEWRKHREALKGLTDHLFLDLGSFSTEETLSREILESPEVEKWKENDSILTLWLDSLDEGLLHILKLQDAILRSLRKLKDFERLRLRITCRNAMWPVAFSEALQRLWGITQDPSMQEFSVMLLSPLTQQQIKEAAEQEMFDVEQFFAAIAQVDAQPLASRPVTLQLLVNLFKANQPTFGIPETVGRAGLYERGCLELCEMPDRARGEQYREDSKARLLLAGYLAYLAVLTNRRQIHIEPVLGLPGPNELDPYAVGAGKTVIWEGMQAPITAKAVRDLLRNTGLFTDLGNGQMVWTHQSFAEFLAAWYLNLAGLPPKSLRPLFRSATDPIGGIVPALQETAAWLAELQPAFWNEVLELDPIALIQADMRRLNSTQSAAVVSRLMSWLSNLAYTPYQESSERNFMHQLCHTGLAEQLKPILTSPKSPGATLKFAIDMTLACEVRELVPTLVTQALNTNLPFSMRALALNILVHLADDKAREQLRPLRLDIPPEDTRDEFRGDLLRILWPSHLTPDELFPLLTPEQNDHYFGSYRSFLQRIEEADIEFPLNSVLASLHWLTQNLPAINHKYAHKEVWNRVNQLVWRRSWQLVNEPGLLEAMTDLFIIAEKYHEPFSVEEAPNEARTRLFERLLARRTRPHSTSIVYNTHNLPSLLKQEDWDSIYPLFFTRLTASAREWLTWILMFLLRETPVNQDRSLYELRFYQLHLAKQNFASSRRAFYSWFKAVKLNSKEAKQSKKNYLITRKHKNKELRKKKNRRKLTLYRIVKRHQRIQQILAKGVAVPFQEWHALLYYISSKKTQTGFIAHNDISQSADWEKLSTTSKTRAVDLACDIVSRYPIPPKESYTLGGGVYPFAISLYRALLLCHSQRPAFTGSLPPSFWEDWASFLVQLDSFSDNNYQYELTKLAAIAAPVAVDTGLFLQADGLDNRQDGSIFYQFENWYKALPQGRFPRQMLTAIKFGVWREDFSASLLVNMLDAGFEPAWDYALHLIPPCFEGPALEVERPRLATAVFKWLLFKRNTARPDSWKYWVQLSTQPDIAATVINESVNRPSPGELQHLKVLDEEQLHVLILWLTYAFQLKPGDVSDWEDINPKGGFGALRTAAAIELASRGTASAWEILQQLSDQMGEPYWLQVRLDQVRENLRRNSWEPITPDALIALGQDSNRRWIKSATDLQELILESLDRFQTDLHDELFAAEVLWSPIKAATNKRKIIGYEVRDENFLSNVIRRHLVQDLQRTDILVKREVEIRSSAGSGTGQRTDIFVEAFIRDARGDKSDVVTVVTEVKLSKNNEVETALNHQLIPYLVDQRYKHGIYLIGWHYGEYDIKPPGKKTLSDLYELLQQQTQAVDSRYSIRTLLLDIRLAADKGRIDTEKTFFKAI